MACVLITGMSGTGKSTVLHELERRGHETVDTDVGEWIELRLFPGMDHPEPVWIERRVDELLATERHGHLFVAGCVINQGEFYDRFDAVVLLTAPLDVLLARVDARTTNDFGKAADERAAIISDVEHIEPLLVRRATRVIDTSEMTDTDTASRLEGIAGGIVTRPRSSPP